MKPNPEQVPMTPQELSEWLYDRGVQHSEIGYWLKEYAGKTLYEMEELYGSLHGDIA